jgi:hypothetical protein
MMMQADRYYQYLLVDVGKIPEFQQELWMEEMEPDGPPSHRKGYST